MTEWTETFNRADLASLDGQLGFVTDNDGTTPLADVQIESTYATHVNPDAAVIAIQDTNVPTTHDQELRVLFTSTAQTPTGSTIEDYYIIGGMYLPDTTGASWGIGVKFNYESDGTRTLDLVENPIGGGLAFGNSPALILTTDVTSRIHKAGISGGAETDLLVLQEMRIITTLREAGLLIRCYFNQDDDDEPTLEYREYRDPFEWTGSSFGRWYFALGPTNPATHLKVAEIHGRDYEERAADTVQMKDRFTLKEIRDHALARVDGSSTGTDRANDEAFMNELINATVEEILDEVGDVAVFMQASESLTFSTDANGYVTMPEYVDKVLSMEDPAQQEAAPWRFVGLTADERVEIQFRKNWPIAGRSIRMKYQMKYHRMDKDGDLCPIPRRFSEALIYGVVMRVAEFDTNQVLHQQNMLRYQQKIVQIRKACNRQLRYSRERLNVPRSIRGISFGKHLTTPRTGY